MKWRSLVTLAAAAAACRVGDLVEAPVSGARLEFSVQPSRADIDKPIVPPVQVTVRDDAGRPDTAYHDSVGLDLGQNPGGANLSGTSRVRVEGGIATFADLRVDKPGSGYVLRATAPGRPAALSSTFGIDTPDTVPADTIPPPTPQPRGLRFTVQPSNTGVNQPISPPVQVEVLDQQGGRITNYTGAVTIDLAPNTLNAAVYGTVTVNAVNGVATFTNLRVNLVGVDFRLRAAFAGQAPIATSNAFIVLL